MKKTAEIIGLPVFSLLDGAEIGRIKQMVVRPEAGRVELFVVENEWDSVGVHILPYPSVIGVGEFAVTVESKDGIRDLTAVEGARDLVLLSYKIIGTRVLSRKGQLVGQVEEYWIDEESGFVNACSFVDAKDHSSVRYFADDNIMTFGRDVIVIHDEVKIADSLEALAQAAEAAADDDASDAQPAPPAAEARQEVTAAEQEAAASAAEQATATAPSADESAPAQQAVTESAKETAELPVGPYAYLVGKHLREELRNEAGDVLAAAGAVITHELIERIKSESPTLFMKLNRLATDNR